jgi:hypothetical protein
MDMNNHHPERLLRIINLVLILLTFTQTGCSPRRSAIIYTDSVDPLVVNGVAFDKAVAPVGGCARVVVPTDAHIERVDGIDDCTVLMKKSLQLAAHPPEMISIDQKRTEMGCAWTIIGDALVIGSFGEYVIEGHGGATQELTVRVPGRLIVERQTDLSGVNSIPNALFGPGAAGGVVRRDQRGNEWTILPSSPAREISAHGAIDPKE